MGHLMNLVATASERSPALGGKNVSPTLLEATTEKLPLRRDEVIDAGAGGNFPEPSNVSLNLQTAELKYILMYRSSY